MGDLLNKLPVNWPLIKNPINWIIIVLMITIAGFGFHFLTKGMNTVSAQNS